MPWKVCPPPAVLSRGWNILVPPTTTVVPLAVEDEGIVVDADVNNIDFVGGGVTVTDTGVGSVQVTIPPGGGSLTPIDATYVTMSSNATLTQERVLTAGTGITITDGGANSTVTIAATPAVGGTSTYVFWGNGEDGSAVLDGVNTFSWCTLTGSRYTMDRAVMLSALTVNSGITLAPQGVIVRVNGNLANAGLIEIDGAASTTNNGALAGGLSSFGTYGPGTAGGNGGNNGNGVSRSQINSLGAAGGAGGNASPNTGGTSTITEPATNVGGVQAAYSIHAAEMGVVMGTNTSPTSLRGGCGGGGGAGLPSANGGGGGGGAGILGIFAKTISGSGTFAARGGAGAIGQSVNCGGGGGGGGGAIYVITTSLNYESTMTVTVAGGAGGAGDGTGGAGAAGGTGRIIRLFVT